MNLRLDFWSERSVESEGNLGKVVELERKAQAENLSANSRTNFLEMVLVISKRLQIIEKEIYHKARELLIRIVSMLTKMTTIKSQTQTQTQTITPTLHSRCVYTLFTGRGLYVSS